VTITNRKSQIANYLKYIYPLSWVILAIPTLFNLHRGADYRFYNSYLTGDFNSLTNNLANGFFMASWFILVAIGYWWLFRNADKLTKRQLILIAIVSSFGAFLTVPFGSTDVFYYLGAARGEITSNINPYLGGFVKINPFHATLFFGSGPIMYPPLWLTINKVLWTISAPFGLLGQAYSYKLIFLICHFLTSWLIYKSTKRFDDFILYFFNPLLLFEFVTNAHYDALMLLFIALGIYLILKDKVILGLTSISSAILTKYTAVLFLPFLVMYLTIEAWKHKKLISQISNTLVAGVVSVMLLTISAYPYWTKTGVTMLKGITAQSDWFVNSFFATLYVPLIWFYKVTTAQNIPSVSAKYLWILLIVIGVTILVKRLIPLITRISLTTLFELLTMVVIVFLIFFQRSFWPWYASWAFLPAVFLAKNNKIFKLALIFTFSSLAFYIPFVFFGHDSTQVLDNLQVLYGLVIFSPVLIYLVSIIRKNSNKFA